MVSLDLAPLLALCLAGNVPPAPAPVADQPLLVSTAWLADHLRDPHLVLFEIGGPETYMKGHIPGAQWISLRDLAAPHDMSVKPMPLALELPAVARLDSVLSSHGVDNDSHVVFYAGEDWITPTARAVLTLEYAGLRGQVSMLDGGRPAWTAEGRPISTEVPKVVPAKFVSHPRSDVVVTVDWLSAHLKDPHIALFDARDPGFYLDTTDNNMVRGGHIPGAKSVPFTTLTDEAGKLHSRADLEAQFHAAGADPGKLVVSYCHVGQQGSLVYLVARYLGYDARLYDGSFQEWSGRTDLAVEGANPQMVHHVE